MTTAVVTPVTKLVSTPSNTNESCVSRSDEADCPVLGGTGAGLEVGEGKTDVEWQVLLPSLGAENSNPNMLTDCERSVARFASCPPRAAVNRYLIEQDQG